MSEIRKLVPDDFGAFITISANAYPAIKLASEDDRRVFKQRMVVADADPTMDYYGCFSEGKLVGGMRLHDFAMTLFEAQTLAGGVGAVAVDLAHKKQHVARDLIVYFLRHYRARGAPLALLYPFRPDFYSAMGFGFGPKLNQYRIGPLALPDRGAREHVRLLTSDDRAQRAECYARYARRTHGMIAHAPIEVERLFGNPEMRVFGYQPGASLEGYVAFRFESASTDNFVLNDLVITELVYETPEALAGLLSALRTQADQVRAIVLNTQDDAFHFNLLDPRNGTDHMLAPVYHESNTQGVGLMYRVIDTPRFFKTLARHHFGAESCVVRFVISDTLLPEHDGSYVVRFAGGLPEVLRRGAHDVEVRMAVAEFSSLVLGCVSFGRLLEYGLATLSDPAYGATLNRLFRAEHPPLCTTGF